MVSALQMFKVILPFNLGSAYLTVEECLIVKLDLRFKGNFSDEGQFIYFFGVLNIFVANLLVHFVHIALGLYAEILEQVGS